MPHARDEKHFSHTKLDNWQNVSTSAAGIVHLGVLGTAEFQISIRGATHNQEFLVCKRVNDDIMSIGLANQLEISYNTRTQKSRQCQIHWSCTNRL